MRSSGGRFEGLSCLGKELVDWVKKEPNKVRRPTTGEDEQDQTYDVVLVDVARVSPPCSVRHRPFGRVVRLDQLRRLLWRLRRERLRARLMQRGQVMSVLSGAIRAASNARGRLTSARICFVLGCMGVDGVLGLPECMLYSGV